MGYNEESTGVKATAIVQQAEELPYFTEKYPGKLCCLCNLSEHSALGQGDMLRLSIKVAILKNCLEEENQMEDIDATVAFGRKKSNTSKVKVSSSNNEFTNELECVGYDEVPLLENIVTEEEYLHIHSMCAMWSLQIKRIEDDVVPKIEEVIAKSLLRRCSFCTRNGASITCRMNCEKNFHLPCAAACGCFLIIESFQIFCVEHLSQVPYIAVDTNLECRQCFSLGDIRKLLMCSTCGGHYHTTCVGLANFPDSRSGWNCLQCCKCLICRQSEKCENRSIKCEQCQKLYHTTCLRPVISSVPKYGWKCNRCRVCSDCGARTPGAGASSRWHCHYTICDSCYQQRNKGFSCPICHKAYRAASHKEMVKCSNCNRFVHSGCDDEADLSAYHLKKETDPDYDYVCPPCKSGRHLVSLGSADTISIFGDTFSRELESEIFDRDTMESTLLVDPLKISKKKIGFKELGRGGKIGKLFGGKGGIVNPISRKRGARGKGRQLLMLNSISQSSTTSDVNSSQCSEEDMSLEKKIILCSAKDKFVLMQDVCVMCGSLGTDQDACLISCVQCGQCYHPHCANVVLSKTMLQKGWRCLDCTVCEGCGQKNDEARLILCDECDISYHIYCMNPPLDAVPNGNWKCNLCAMCQKCGRNSPGKNCSWLNGFLECGPCASQQKCSYCSQPYNENELIIQCSSCERWLHCLCDNIRNEEEAKHFNDFDYQCKTCLKDMKYPTKPICKALSGGDNTIKTLSVSSQAANGVSSHALSEEKTCASGAPYIESAVENTDNTFCIDGVCVSEHGFNMIRSLTTEIKKKRKLKSDGKDATIMSAIDSVIAGSSNAATKGDMCADGNTMSADKIANTSYKDGMIWVGEEGSQPEGFSISTNEEGVNILRKKRQRNLQKLGIGGFNVRMRGIRKDNEEIYMGSLENPSLTDDKRKKIIKKKFKSKLCESYPSYLQEAFFGKDLLSNNEPVNFNDSDSSEDYFINPNDNIPNASSILQNSSMVKIETTDCIIDSLKGNNTDTISKEPNEECNNSQMSAMIFSNKSASEEEHRKNASCDDKLVHTETTSDVTKNSVQISMSCQYSAQPMNGSSKLQQQLQPSSGHISTAQNLITGKMVISNACASVTQQNQNPKMVMYHSYEQQENVQSKQVSKYLTQKSDDPLLSQIKYEHEAMHAQPVASTERINTETIETPMLLDETVKEPVVPGTQKTAEKMRKDEDLGAMSTISAVLYANTQHPELKQLFPNWNERCKQILKKWRSLSTEMKAPFLQQAKDNRSVLRLRRSQQEPEKTYFQQKSLKEQEQERVWKQHQAKNKESNSNKFLRNAFVDEFSASDINSSVTQKHQQQTLFDMNFLEESSEECSNKQASHLETTEHTQANSDIGKSQSHLHQHHQSLFMTAMNQQMEHPPPQHSAQMDDMSKVFEPNKQSDQVAALQISERNDIFLNDKNWAGVGKLPNSKDSEKIEADENGGLGDILGGFGEGDDDDILKSLTAEIGDDFNILEYADPELDEINGSQNLLNKLDFDENQKAI